MALVEENNPAPKKKIKVRGETVQNIARMGQKEALRKYHAGEGDEEYKEAINRYYSKRRIEAAKGDTSSKPSSEVQGTVKQKNQTPAERKASAEAVERRLSGIAHQGPGMSTAMGKGRPSATSKPTTASATIARAIGNKSTGNAAQALANLQGGKKKKSQGTSRVEKDYERLYGKK